VNLGLSTEFKTGWDHQSGTSAAEDAPDVAPGQGALPLDEPVGPDTDLALGDLTGLEFKSVQVNAAVTVPHFLDAAIQDIQKVTTLPVIKQVIAAANTEIPLIDKKLIDLAAPNDGSVADVVKLLGAINNLDVTGGDNTLTYPLLDLGDLSLKGDISPLQEGTLSTDLSALSDFNFQSVLGSSPEQLIDQLVQDALGDVGGDSGDLSTLLSGTSSQPGAPPDGLQFPFLTDKGETVMKLLLGQNVPLVTFQVTPVALALQASAGLDLFGVVGLGLSGTIDVNMSLKVGYDTKGIRDYLNSTQGFTSAGTPLDLLNGFYVDTGSDQDGNPHTGIALHGDIGLFASAGIKVTGGIGANVAITVTGDQDEPDKRRLSKFFSQPDPLLEASGDFYAEANVSAGVNLGVTSITFFQYTLARVELLHFDTAPPAPGHSIKPGPRASPWNPARPSSWSTPPRALSLCTPAGGP
jgi:hypothetical protein